MATLTGQLVAETYKALLKTINNDVITASEVQISDGYGQGTNVFLDQNGFVRASKYKVTGGNSSQFLKGDGSLDGTSYLPSGTTTTSIPEGTNQYFTQLKVLNSNLAGFTPVSGTVSSSDSVLSALEKIWWNILNGGGGGGGGYVPYSGATQNLNLGEFGLLAGNIRFDTTPTNIPTAQGSMYWDADHSTVALIMNGLLQKIGEDLVYPVKNQTGATITKGTAVGFAGTLGASGRLLISPFLADGSQPSSYFMGIVSENIANGDNGFVTYLGQIRQINTSAYPDDSILYVSPTTAGALTATKPIAPNNIIQVAAVVNSATNGTLQIRITLGSSLKDDEMVYLNPSTLANNDGIFYNSTTERFENRKLIKTDGFIPYFDATDLLKNSPIFVDGVNVTMNGMPLLLSDEGELNYITKFGSTKTIVNSLLYDSGVNVGLGTTDPLFKFHIQGGDLGIYNSSIAYGYQIFTNNNYRFASATGFQFLVDDVNTGSVQVRIDTLGRLGVGVVNPAYKIDAGGDINISTGSVYRIAGNPYSVASATLSGFLTSTDWVNFNNKTSSNGTLNYLAKYSSYNTLVDSLLYDSGTKIGIGTTNPEYLFTVVGGSMGVYSSSTNYGYIDTANTSMRLVSANGFNFTANNIGTIANTRVEANGNWGFGIGTPAYKVDVNGDVNTNGIYRVNGSQITTANVLENASFLYFTKNRVLGTELTGLNVALTGDVVAADSLIVGISKLQNQVSGKQPLNSNLTSLAGLNYGTSAAFVKMTSANTFTLDTTTYQPLLTNPITGTGTNGQVAFFTGSTTQSSDAGLFWDNTNKRLGIGTSTPSSKFHVYGGDSTFEASTSNANLVLKGSATNESTIYFLTGSTYKWNIGTSSNDLTFYKFQVGAGEAMRLTSTGNVGIGTTSPTNAKLKVSGSSASGAIISEDTSGTTSFVRILGDISSQNLINWQTGTAIRFATSNQDYSSFVERMRLDSSGNLGLGVTPSVWTGLGKAFETTGGALLGQGTNNITLYQNVYYSAGYKYKTTGQASMYEQTAGNHKWYNAISGTLDTAISFTQAMTLSASGNLSIGNTNNTYKLDVSGQMMVRGVTSASDGSLNIESTDPALRFRVTGGTADKRIYEWRAIAAGTIYDYLQLRLWNDAQNSTTELFKITSAGAATFSNSITINNPSTWANINIVGSTTAQGGQVDFYGSTIRYGTIVGEQESAGVGRMLFRVWTGSGVTPVTALTLASTGIATFSNTVSNLNNLIYSGGSLFLRNPANTFDWALYHDASNNLKIDFNGTNRFLLTSGGNVGIGTTSPSDKLSVDGSIRVLTGGAVNFNRPDNGAASSILMNSSNQLVFTSPSGAVFSSPISIKSSAPFIQWLNTSDSRLGYIQHNATDLVMTADTGNVILNTPSNKHIGINMSTIPVSTVGKYIWIGDRTGIMDDTFSSSYFLSNATYNNGWKYVRDGYASNILLDAGGNIYFQNAGTGVAGNAATFSSRMIINASGNVGIGTTSPQSKLDIVGTSAAGGTDGILVSNTTSTLGTKALFGVTSNTFSFGSLSGNTTAIFSAAGSPLTLLTTDANDVRILTNYTERVRVTSTGNVGIGTTSPISPLTVKSQESAARGITLLGRSDSIGTLRFFNSAGTTEQGGLISTSTYLGFTYADTERMRITSGGNVGIGTTSPSNKLEVIGFTLLNYSAGADTYPLIIKNALLKANNNYLGFKLQSSDASPLEGNFLLYGGTNPRLDIGAYNNGVGAANVNIPYGNLGVGTISPAYKLDVNGDINVANAIRYNVSGTQYGITFANAGAFGIEAYQGTYFFIGTGSGASATERFRITNSGNVGIGTNNPGGTLHVAGGGSVIFGSTPNFNYKFNVQGFSGKYISFWTPTIQSVNNNGLMSHDGNGLSGLTPMGYNASIHVFNGEVTGGGTLQVAGDVNITGSFRVNNVPITSGGGATSLAGLTDVGITSPSTGQILVYDASVSKWKNQANTVSGVTGSGTSGYVPLWSGTTSLGNSVIQQVSNNIVLGSTAWSTMSTKLIVQGGIAVVDVIGAWMRNITIDSAGSVNFNNGYNTASLSAAGNWLNASDISYKKNIMDIKYSINDIINLNPRNYEMKVDNSKHIGFIAQELIDIIPEVVERANDGKLMVDYGALVSLAIQGIKELKAEIELLKSKQQ